MFKRSHAMTSAAVVAVSANPRHEGLVELRSVSRNGEATTTARFAWGTSMQTTLLNVRERLDNARSQLPERAERGVVVKVVLALRTCWVSSSNCWSLNCKFCAMLLSRFCCL